MTVMAIVLAGVATVVALVALAASAELLNSLKELQERVGYEDRPTSLTELTGRLLGQRPSRLGLPLEADQSRLVLFLSPKCLTCFKVATGLGGLVPDDLHVVVSGREKLHEWLSDAGLQSHSVTIDEGGVITEGAGINTFPVALIIQEQTVVHAYSIPSHPSLQRMLVNVRRQDPKTVKGGL